MANEAAVLQGGAEMSRVETGTITAGTVIPVGTLLVHEGTLTVAHTAANVCRPAGFSVESSTATSTSTVIGYQTSGDVLAYIDGVVTAGDAVVVSQTTANRVRRITTTGTLSYQEANMIVGRAKESGTDGQQIRIKLTLG